MAEPTEALLPDSLMAEILAFVRQTASPSSAFVALLGGAVGACTPALGVREIAETLWRIGDYAIERAAPCGANSHSPGDPT